MSILHSAQGRKRVRLACLLAGVWLAPYAWAYKTLLPACPDPAQCVQRSFAPLLQADQALRLQARVLEADTGNVVLDLDMMLASQRALYQVRQPQRFAGSRILQRGRQSWFFMPELAKPLPILPRQMAASELHLGLPLLMDWLQGTTFSELDTSALPLARVRLSAQSLHSAVRNVDYWWDTRTGQGVKAQEIDAAGGVLATMTLQFSGQSGLPDVPSEIKIRRRDGLCCDRDVQYRYAHVFTPPPLAFSLTDLVRP
ncbi:hypothetical protein [Alcaligenes sp. SDU_A2]|uniref:hypothetical protein n=1 Tax=Alcaligenes sp. SDU_A2 TaxID=3136634 RepID=UPI00311DFAA0